MNLCERLINACIAADCDNAPFTGSGSVGYIFNKAQIAGFTYDQTNPNIITGITMKTYEESDGQGGTDDVSYVGYKIQQLGKQPFTGTNTTMVEGTTMNKFTETVNFVVPDNSPAASMLLNSLANGKFVIVLKNEYDGSDNRGGWQVYGAKKGLVASSMDRDIYSEETDGTWAVSLVSENAPDAALFIEHKTGTDVDTEEYLETLVSCE